MQESCLISVISALPEATTSMQWIRIRHIIPENRKGRSKDTNLNGFSIGTVSKPNISEEFCEDQGIVTSLFD